MKGRTLKFTRNVGIHPKDKIVVNGDVVITIQEVRGKHVKVVIEEISDADYVVDRYEVAIEKGDIIEVEEGVGSEDAVRIG